MKNKGGKKNRRQILSEMRCLIFARLCYKQNGFSYAKEPTAKGVEAMKAQTESWI